MIWMMLMALAALLAAEVPQPPQTAGKIVRQTALADLAGAWQQVDRVIDGKSATIALPPVDTYTAAGEVTRRVRDEVVYTARISVDSTRTPKTIDYTQTSGVGAKPAGVRLGVYEITGDVLRICVAREGEGRPTSLEACKTPGLALETFRRRVQ